jgi:hypothetical protein
LHRTFLSRNFDENFRGMRNPLEDVVREMSRAEKSISTECLFYMEHFHNDA